MNKLTSRIQKWDSLFSKFEKAKSHAVFDIKQNSWRDILEEDKEQDFVEGMKERLNVFWKDNAVEAIKFLEGKDPLDSSQIIESLKLSAYHESDETKESLETTCCSTTDDDDDDDDYDSNTSYLDIEGTINKLVSEEKFLGASCEAPTLRSNGNQQEKKHLPCLIDKQKTERTLLQSDSLDVVSTVMSPQNNLKNHLCKNSLSLRNIKETLLTITNEPNKKGKVPSVALLFPKKRNRGEIKTCQESIDKERWLKNGNRTAVSISTLPRDCMENPPPKCAYYEENLSNDEGLRGRLKGKFPSTADKAIEKSLASKEVSHCNQLSRLKNVSPSNKQAKCGRSIQVTRDSTPCQDRSRKLPTRGSKVGLSRLDIVLTKDNGTKANVSATSLDFSKEGRTHDILPELTTPSNDKRGAAASYFTLRDHSESSGKHISLDSSVLRKKKSSERDAYRSVMKGRSLFNI